LQFEFDLLKISQVIFPEMLSFVTKTESDSLSLQNDIRSEMLKKE